MARSIPLAKASFVVVDIETTGSMPGQDGFLELAAVRVENGEITDTFCELINPRQDIPAFVQKLTGITPAMVADAPPIEAVFPRFMEFLGDSLFVAHNASFDFQFISVYAKRLLGEHLDNPMICTLRLSKKLQPELKKRNLGFLTELFEIDIAERHRALGDAQGTAELLLRYLEMLKDQGITTQAKLLDYHDKGGRKHGDLKVPYPIEKLADLPCDPGVYLMRNQHGELLYVGKAVNLRKRVTSYFTGLKRQPPKVRELMQLVMDIEHRVLGSELEALLAEAELIQTHQPLYNRYLKRFKSLPYLKITMQDHYPKLETTTDLESDGALYFGPYRREGELKGVIDALNKAFQLRFCSDTDFKRHGRQKAPCMAYELKTCSAPCIKGISLSDYRERIGEIIAYLSGEPSEVLEKLAATRDQLSEQLAFESAGEIQMRLGHLESLQTRTEALSKAVHQNHLVILEPSQGGMVVLYVFAGRPVQRQWLANTPESLENVMDQVRNLLVMIDTHQPQGIAIPQTELEQVRILTQWLKSDTQQKNAAVWALPLNEVVLGRGISRFFDRHRPASEPQGVLEV